MVDLVLTAQEFRLLDGLRLNPRKSFHGKVRGERLTKRKGVSIDFSDYRDYTEGDDLRHMDWNVFARLDHPIVKTYQDEEDLAVHLLVDTSSSMAFGDPTKLGTALKLACAVGYVGLQGGDAVTPVALGGAPGDKRALRGRSSYARLAAWATAVQPQNRVGLSQSLQQFAASSARPGAVFLISDCLDPEVTSGIKHLAGRGHELFCLHTLAPEDIDPDLEGDLRLIDSESGEAVEITANSPTLKAYRENLAAHSRSVEETVTRMGGRYTLVTTSRPLDQLVTTTLRKERWMA